MEEDGGFGHFMNAGGARRGGAGGAQGFPGGFGGMPGFGGMGDLGGFSLSSTFRRRIHLYFLLLFPICYPQHVFVVIVAPFWYFMLWRPSWKL